MQPLIFMRLSNADMKHWIPVIEILLKRLNGIEDYMENENSEEKPLNFFDKLSVKIERWDTEPLAKEINISKDILFIQDVAHAPFFYYRARNDSGFWDPLKESFNKFKKHGNPIVWQDFIQVPDPKQVASWINRQRTTTG